LSGWMFLLVPAYPGCPGSKAVKQSLLLLLFVANLLLSLTMKTFWKSVRIWWSYGHLFSVFFSTLNWLAGQTKRPLNGCVCVCVSYSVSLITIEDHKKSYVGLSDKPLLNPCDGPQGVSTYKAPYFATPITISKTNWARKFNFIMLGGIDQ